MAPHVGHARGIRSLRRGHAEGESAATLVRVGSHSCYAGVAAPVGVRNRVVRPFPGGVGLRVVVAQGSRYRAALARAVNSHEKALSRREPGVVSSVGQSGSI